MFETRYKGRRIEVTRSAMDELLQYDKTLTFVKEILENGYAQDRAADTVEKWLDRGEYTFNAVVKEAYNDVLNEKTWLLIHVGRFTR